MKRLIYLILLAAIFITSCEKDNVVAVIKTDVGAPVVIAPVNASSITILEADLPKQFSVKWNKADFGVQAVSSYVIQLDAAGKNFATAINLGSTTNNSFEITLATLNDKLLNTLMLPANANSDVELRIIATLGEKNKTISKVVKVTVKTYKELAPEQLSVPGQYQGWAPPTAPKIRLQGDSKYEGYVYMSVGDYYKFTSHPDWDHINYGDGGAGKLTTDGLAGGLKVSDAGYYKFNVDTKNLTYSAVLINSFGLIGSATAGVWDNSTPMTYDVATGVWKVTANLIPGALKFRANNNWEINYGPADVNALTGTLVQTDNAITITAGGSYTVTIDFRQAATNKYYYTVVKN